jgi:CRP-like cAMP-binding protein
LDDEDAHEIRRDLQNIRLFSDALRPDQLDELALACSRQFFRPDTVMMRQGDCGAVMFCIVAGEVSISFVDRMNRRNEISRLRAGTVVGEIEILTGERRMATVTALTEVCVLEVPKRALENLFSRSPDLIENLGATLAIRQAMLDQIAPDQSGSIKARLVAKMRAVFPGKLGRTDW